MGELFLPSSCTDLSWPGRLIEARCRVPRSAISGMAAEKNSRLFLFFGGPFSLCFEAPFKLLGGLAVLSSFERTAFFCFQGILFFSQSPVVEVIFDKCRSKAKGGWVSELNPLKVNFLAGSKLVCYIWYTNTQSGIGIKVAQ